MKHISFPDGNPRKGPYLNSAEAAEFLRISLSLLYKLSANNEIKKHKRRGMILFKEEDLIVWVEGGAEKAPEEITDSVNGILDLITKK